MAVLLGELSLAHVSVAIPVCLVVWYIVSSIAAWYRLRHIPGPFLASFSCKFPDRHRHLPIPMSTVCRREVIVLCSHEEGMT